MQCSMSSYTLYLWDIDINQSVSELNRFYFIFLFFFNCSDSVSGVKTILYAWDLIFITFLFVHCKPV